MIRKKRDHPDSNWDCRQPIQSYDYLVSARDEDGEEYVVLVPYMTSNNAIIISSGEGYDRDTQWDTRHSRHSGENEGGFIPNNTIWKTKKLLPL